MQQDKEGQAQLVAKGHLLFLESWIGLLGAGLSLIGLAFGVLVLYLTFVHNEVAYLALFYVGDGLLLAAGLSLTALGWWRAARRRRLGLAGRPHLLFTLDLNKPAHQTTALIAVVATVIGMGVFTSATYLGIHWAESDQFCTQACHSVMRPEGVAHLNSAHANVHCVDCHVGSGAGSFFQAKLNGMRQLYGVVTGDYSRPIETPIHNMKKASEICEGCHWRDRYIGYKVKSRTYYAANDEENTPRQIRMLINVGGPKPGGNGGEGIHYHMLGRKVEFIARDRQKQQIAYVKVTEPDGSIKEFNDGESPLTDEERKAAKVYTMDCLDCHNRPAHRYRAPMPAMNEAMQAGRVDPEIPYIKKKGVEVLSTEYATTEEGVQKIAETLTNFYKEEYPEVLEEQRIAFDGSVAAIQRIFLENFFPEMKVRWKAYPENTGHRDFPGCFRCHNDRLVDEDDEAIFTDCKGCHIVLTQGSEIAKVEPDLSQGLAFFHPDDEDYIKDYNDCGECHTGGADTYDE